MRIFTEHDELPEPHDAAASRVTPSSGMSGLARATPVEVTEAALAPLAVHQTGQMLMATPLLNKDTAFTQNERWAFDLLGLLPAQVLTLDEQARQAYENFARVRTDLERYIFLAALQDRNETLFYRLLHDHIEEMSSIIYTPVVGQACVHYSHIYRRPRGLYLSYPLQQDLEVILRAAPLASPHVIVVTDGERILGLGDQGVGGMPIPIGKLALYTLCGGINPADTLPIVLDVGTDNPTLLNDPLYVGWRSPRVRGAAYDEFTEAFVRAVQRVFPHALLQWEDFAKDNARRLLDRYRDELCTFNDDIQGTAAVTLAGLLAATAALGQPLAEQRLIFFGAGSAATGVAELLITEMMEQGCGEAQARETLWLVDHRGLVAHERDDLDPEKRRFARPSWRAEGSDGGLPSLLEVVARVRPTALIGTAAQAGAFSREIITEMARHVPRPIIFALSNPTEKSEATPADMLAWTDGRALVATGSPFPDVPVGGRTVRIGQCNNMFVFPGLGLGVLAARARRVTDSMFLAAAHALSAAAPSRSDPAAPLYPQLSNVRAVSRGVALAVAREAQAEGVAPLQSPEALEQHLDELIWQPRYRPLVRAPC
jgi:malate dehydrogenase (oxaloacetate-decarboxylating)